MKKTLLACILITALIGGLRAEDKTAIGAILSKVKLHRSDGKEFKSAKLEKSPEYYILYYSASW